MRKVVGVIIEPRPPEAAAFRAHGNGLLSLSRPGPIGSGDAKAWLYDLRE